MMAEQATEKLSKRKAAPRGHCTLDFERAAWELGAARVAGLDEVGRGPLFGPVVAAACILPHDYPIAELRDSKQLSAKKRERLAAELRAGAAAWAVAEVSAGRIDEINIRQASREAMRLAVEQLAPPPEWILVDGNCAIEWEGPQQTVVHGDALVASIAAASILAKVHRDAMLERWALEYPQYLLEKNKGYPTAEHLEALRRHGPTPLHRRSFAPVRRALAEHR
jgi:ribonuclease HII